MKIEKAKAIWCKNNMISGKAMKNAFALYQEMKSAVYVQNKFYESSFLKPIPDIEKKEELNERIMKCIFSSYFTQLSKMKMNYDYHSLFVNTSFKINFNSALYNKKPLASE